MLMYCNVGFYLSIACIVLGLIFLAIYIVEKCRGYSAKMVVLKSRVSLCFIACGMCGLLFKGVGLFAVLMLLGLVFGFAGDIWLDLKLIAGENERRYTYQGFRSFMAGHVCFIIAIMSTFGGFEKPMFPICAIILGIVIGLLIIVIGEKTGLDFGEYKLISSVYSCLVFFMAFLAGAYTLQNGFSNISSLLIFIAGILFAISDIILSQMYFGKNNDTKARIAMNNILYYAAQFVMAMSVVLFVC